MELTADTWRLGSVQRASTTEQVLRELREAIIEGRIAQGEPLREVTLARLLGTGRSAIREAIRQLVQEGLVDYQLHRGACVRSMSLADRLDVFVAREAIEVGAARRILDAARPIDPAPVRGAVEQLRAVAAGRRHVTEAMIIADICFHRELVGLAGSPRLARAHDTLGAETRMLLRHHPEYPGADYVTDHERLLDALERRHPRLPDLVAAHLRLSARLIGQELAREAG